MEIVYVMRPICFHANFFQFLSLTESPRRGSHIQNIRVHPHLHWSMQLLNINRFVSAITLHKFSAVKSDSYRHREDINAERSPASNYVHVNHLPTGTKDFKRTSLLQISLVHHSKYPHSRRLHLNSRCW